jgi:serine/threonine-protein kinase
MEHLLGTNLKEILKNRGRLEIDEALSLMVQACAGIGYAHRAGLIHCDIKSHNLVVSPDKRLKVTDFGIARALASIEPDEQIDYVWGSPQYFSPEQAAGGAPSPASDVYSLGVIMYEMLTGQLPFEGQTMEALSRSHRETMPLSPRDINPDIPNDLEQIVLKVLSKEPAARYRTADQLGRVLITYSRPSRIRAANQPAEKPSPSPEPILEPEPVTSAGHVDFKPVSSPVPMVDIDWVGFLLGLLALVAVGGLIPFWIWVYFVFNPPVP